MRTAVGIGGIRVKSGKKMRKMDMLFCIMNTTWLPVPCLGKERRAAEEPSPQKRDRKTSVNAESF